MGITKVKYFVVSPPGYKGMVASCSVILDNSLLLTNIKLFERDGEKIIQMPTRTLKKYQKNVEIFHPVSKSFYEYLKSTIVEGYNNYKETGSYDYYPED